MRLSPVVVPLVLVLAASLTACGSSDDTGAPTSSQGATTDGDSVAVTIKRQGDKFTPNGERVDLAVDQTLVLTIDADQAGELHVHSTPEQEIQYDAGTSEHELTIDRPGVVEVESHEPPLVLLQLEVR
jgi:hypothetical protein